MLLAFSEGMLCEFLIVGVMPTDKSSGPSISITFLQEKWQIVLDYAMQIKGLRVIFLHSPYMREVKLLDS